MQQLELAANRAMTTTRREADIGKARRPLRHANRHASRWCSVVVSPSCAACRGGQYCCESREVIDSCLSLQRFRGQVDRVSTLPLLPDMPAPKMKAAVKHLRDMWSLQRPAKRAKRQGVCFHTAMQVSSAAEIGFVLPLLLRWDFACLPSQSASQPFGPAAAGAAEQQASSSAAFSAETDSILRHIAQQKNTGTGELREADHMQPAAMELLQGLQQALGSGTGLVLVDTHSSGHLTGPVKKIDCSGLAANNPLWSQLVVPFEFKLHTTDADAAFGQLTETANLVRQQQPERKSLCGVSISLDTVEVFSFDYGPRASFSRIYSSGAQPLKLQSGSAGLRLLASIVAAPLSQLGFEPASLPDGQLADCSFTCTARLALRSESGTQGARQSSRVYLAELDGNRPAVLKLAKTSREVGFCVHELLSRMTVTTVCLSMCKARFCSRCCKMAGTLLWAAGQVHTAARPPSRPCWHYGLASDSLDAFAQAKILTRIWQALQGSNQIVRLLAAGPYHFNGDDWEAVLVEPVVKPLKAGLCVQKMAQVTYDIADAVEQLTKLKIAHCDISPNNIGILDGRGWLFDFGAAKVGSDCT